MSNSGGVYCWSKTAASNASADNTVNWAEGQAPSTVNDSARSLMASTAKFRDDISGAIVTTGTSAAYIVASNQQFDTLANFHGQVICFSPHVTNAAGGVTMTVDFFANIPVRTAPNTALPAGTLIAGTPYTATYNNTDGALYLHGFYGNPYNCPIGGMMDYICPAVPNSSFIFPAGQAISRTTYGALFALTGTTYGTGDGSITFNVPDLTGRVTAMKEAVATRLTTAGGGVDGATMGAVGGAQNYTLTTAQIPSHTHANSLTDPGHTHTIAGNPNNAAATNANGSYDDVQARGAGGLANHLSTNTTGITITNAAQGGGGAHPIMQPTIVVNKILRII